MRFVFRVKARGRLSNNCDMIHIPKEGALQDVIINAGTVNKAKKLARKQHDETFWLLGILDESNNLIKATSKRYKQLIGEENERD